MNVENRRLFGGDPVDKVLVEYGHEHGQSIADAAMAGLTTFCSLMQAPLDQGVFVHYLFTIRTRFLMPQIAHIADRMTARSTAAGAVLVRLCSIRLSVLGLT